MRSKIYTLTQFQLCFETFFICTLNASRFILVNFNLSCRLYGVLLEKRLHGCQIFRGFRFFISESKPNLGFPHTPNILACNIYTGNIQPAEPPAAPNILTGNSSSCVCD